MNQRNGLSVQFNGFLVFHCFDVFLFYLSHTIHRDRGKNKEMLIHANRDSPEGGYCERQNDMEGCADAKARLNGYRASELFCLLTNDRET